MRRIDEHPIRYGRSTPLVGVWTTAEGEGQPGRDRPSDAPTVVFLNAGLTHRTGPARLYTGLARALAEQGISAFRFDLAGIGDSPARRDGLPIPDGVARDIHETLDMLQRRFDARRFVLLGLCAGADNALHAATEDPRVVGLALLDPTVHRTPGWHLRYYAGRAVRTESWRNLASGRSPLLSGLRARLRGEPAAEAGTTPEYFRAGPITPEALRARWEATLGRDVRVLLVFTGDWAVLFNHPRQFAECYPGLPTEGRVDLRHRPSSRHTFVDPADRRWLTGSLLEWLARLPPGATAGEPSAAAPATADAPGVQEVSS